ncbi:hypothetical protein MLD38_003289 [Melastoma candidum]|uniref:Uncharacterized protein n=1 Tax=Melastoma candidum TaxID=119954 RepID=A0ACB9S3N3_9MYRT|nr:hypothetical protein MLD38_003289 [Melastoma candidum]
MLLKRRRAKRNAWSEEEASGGSRSGLCRRHLIQNDFVKNVLFNLGSSAVNRSRRGSRFEVPRRRSLASWTMGHRGSRSAAARELGDARRGGSAAVKDVGASNPSRGRSGKTRKGGSEVPATRSVESGAALLGKA